MRTIWKYVLQPHKHPQGIEVSEGATVLTAREQGDQVCIWVDHDTLKPVTTRRFEVFGTGWDMPPGERRYIGTAQFTDGSPLVFHVYERLDR